MARKHQYDYSEVVKKGKSACQLAVVRPTEAVYSQLLRGPMIMESFTVSRNADLKTRPKGSIFLIGQITPARVQGIFTTIQNHCTSLQNKNYLPTLGRSVYLFSDLLRQISQSVNV